MNKINYKGLNIIIENPVGSVRRGNDHEGKPWATRFFYPYGYIENTKGVDGEGVDCFVGDNPTADSVYIVHQLGPNGLFDEDKCFVGFNSKESARDAFMAHYSTQGFIGKITAMPFYEFKDRIEKEGKKGISIT